MIILYQELNLKILQQPMKLVIQQWWKTITTLVVIKVVTKVSKKSEGSKVSPETTEAKMFALVSARAAALTCTMKPATATNTTY